MTSNPRDSTSEEAASTTAYKRQHLVSGVLLRRWAESKPGRDEPQLTVFGRDTRETRLTAVKNVAVVSGFDNWDATKSEERWQEIEARFPAAFAAVEDGSAMARSDVVETLKDLFALHWARSFMLDEIHRERVPAIAMERHEALFDDPAQLDAAFYDRYGLHPAGPGARTIIAKEITAGALERLAAGPFFHDRVHDNFGQARQLLDELTLEVVTAADGEFVIGDTPALTIGNDARTVGPLRGDVPWHQAGARVLPLGPHHVLRTGPAEPLTTVGRDGVELLNSYQFAGARREVYGRPSGDMVLPADE